MANPTYTEVYELLTAQFNDLKAEIRELRAVIMTQQEVINSRINENRERIIKLETALVVRTRLITALGTAISIGLAAAALF